MRGELASAYVLHARPYRDSSQLLEIVTGEHGRMALIARGSRGKSGGRGGGRAVLLQPFRPLLMSWSGRGEMGTLTQVESAGRAVSLQGEAMYSGFYLNELLLRLTARNDPSPELFAYYHEALHALPHDADRLMTLRLFEKRLLDVLGYGPAWTQTAAGEFIAAACHYAYQPQSGIVESPQGIAGAALLALAAEQFDDVRHAVAVRPVLQAMLNELLGSKPLNSRVLLRAWLQQKGNQLT